MADLPAWLKPGVVVDGKYELVRLLGKGGMGVVYEARHRTLGERVAVKVMLAAAAHSPEATARFLREARAAFAVRNEHVARVLDAGTAPSGDPYLVMELLEGTDLAQLVKARGPLVVADAVEYVAQACEALSVAHAHGIVHRDVKPANLFLARRPDGSPMVKVLDFGIAKANEPAMPGLTETNVGIGTLLYMSPEQVKAARDVDARADVYSLGATLYELLTGRPPYDAPSAAELIVQILHVEGRPVRALRADVPPALEAVIARAMRKARDERFPSADIFASAARAALSAPPAAFGPEAPPGPLPLYGPNPLASTAAAPAVYPPRNHGLHGEGGDFAGNRMAPYRFPQPPVPFAPPWWTPYPPRRSVSLPLAIGGGVVTLGGLLAFVAAAIPGVVNGAEIGTAVAIGVAACVLGAVMIAVAVLRR